MARIKKITIGATSTVVHPTEVDCEVSTTLEFWTVPTLEK